jgi:hypothetical protein
MTEPAPLELERAATPPHAASTPLMSDQPADPAASDPVEAPPGSVVHIRFRVRQSLDETIRAMEIVKEELRARPGATRVIVHIPQAGGAQQLPMEQRGGVAWDPTFAARIRARVGADAVELEVIPAVDAA